ncbi:MAG: hypothetical protein JO041_01785 [Acidobacteria bacterium]|nr:hypothetical protein [Acidobacteriota bacterium]
MLSATGMTAGAIVRDSLVLLTAAIQMALMGMLVWKKLWRGFPAFTAYTALHVAALPAQVVVRHVPHPSYMVYFFVYWCTAALSAILTFAVIYELYMQVFRRYEGMSKAGAVLLNCAAAILLLAGVVAAAFSTGPDYSRLIQGILAVRQAVDILRLGLVFFLFAIAGYFKLQWPSHIFGLVVGFAFYASCELAGEALHFRLGPSAAFAYSLLVTVAYGCTVLIWLYYVAARRSEREQPFELPANDLAIWNNALAGMLKGR